MRPFPRPLIALARSRQGLVTAAELTESGYTGRARALAIDTGQLVPVHRGVYRLASHEVTYRQRCAGALLAAPDATLSGPAAAQIWDLRRVATDDVHILARRTIDLRGVHAHRTDFLRPSDVVERAGLRVLRPARLLCDLAGYLDDAGLESVYEQMIERRLLSVPLARAMARAFVARGRPGSRRLSTVLDARDAWLRPPDSDLELRLWRELRRRGVALVRQHPVALDDGRTVRLDLADPAVRLAVEVDHVAWHGGRLETESDKRRDRQLARVGWAVSRVTDTDLGERLDETCHDLVAIIARRAGDLRQTA